MIGTTQLLKIRNTEARLCVTAQCSGKLSDPRYYTEKILTTCTNYWQVEDDIANFMLTGSNTGVSEKSKMDTKDSILLSSLLLFLFPLAFPSIHQP